jgi:hypothetical protein
MHGREPVAQWQAWATVFRLVVTLVAAVRNNEIGRPDYWRLLLNRDSAPPASLDEATRLLTDQLQKFLYVGLVLPKVDLARPRITFQGPGLFGALAAQLLLVAAGTRALAWCTECRLPYVPDRRPAPERRTYCPDCCKRGFPQRDASTAYRRKQLDIATYLASSIRANPWLSPWLSARLSELTPRKM